MHATEPTMRTVDLDGCRLTTATWGEGSPEIIMLHEGLGSIAQWRDVPSDIAARSGRTVMAYDRAGHGASTPIPSGPWPSDWMHHEAIVLGELIVACGAAQPVVVGHSDGGSTALIHASTAGQGVAGVLTLAAHSWVEPICLQSIVAMRADSERLIAGLSRYHDAPAAIFEAWSGVWVSDAFQTWDIRPMIGSIAVPTLIAQGADDPYATKDHPISTAQAIGRDARFVLPEGVGHIMHRDDPELVTQLIVDFVTEVAATAAP